MSQKLLAEDNVALAAKLKKAEEQSFAFYGGLCTALEEIKELERELKEQRETIKQLEGSK